MKSIKRLFLITAFALISVFSLLFAACGGSSTPAPQEEEKKSSIILNVDSLDLNLGETFTIMASLNNVTGEIVWQSSNASVATVDGNGKVTALSDGIVTITATVGETTAKCYVTVVDHGYVPVLIVNNKTITLMEGDSYSLGAKLVKNKEELSVSFAYENTDENVAEVQNGVVTAKNAGKTSVVITAVYENVSYTETVEISVIKEMSIQTDVSNVKLYTSDLAGGATSAEIAYFVDGIENADVSVVYDSEYVTVTKTATNVLVQAVKVGTSEVKLQFTDSGIVYDAIVTVVCEKPVFNAGAIYTLTGAANNGKTEISLGGSLSVGALENVELNGSEVSDYTKEENAIKVDSALLNKGDNAFKLSFENVDVQGVVVLADIVIDDTTDFDEFIRKLVGLGKGTENTQSSELYVVLASDINYNGGDLATNTGRTNYDTNWCGFFDGRGHVISNIVVDRGGVFGYIRGGIVNNLGLLNITSNKNASDTGGLLCMMLTGGGAVENCFVQGAFTNASTTTGGAIAEFAYNGNKVNNCITVVSGAKYAISGQENGNYVIPKFSYAVSADATYAYRTSVDGLYQNSVACVNAVDFTEGNGWNAQWKITNGQITFGSYMLENVQTLSKTIEIATAKQTQVTVDLSEYKATEVTSVFIGTAQVSEFTFKNGEISFATKYFTDNAIAGESSIIINAKIGAAGCSFVQKAVVVTHLISTATELTDFVKVLVGYGKGGDNLQSSAIYAVLANDIDYKGGNLVTNTDRTNYDTNWCGVFDGRGFVISNIVVDRGGVFGYIRGGIVKNLGLVNITSNKSAANTGGLLCMMLTGGGLIDNCFVQGSFTNASTATGGGIAEFAYGGNTITNCFTVVSGAKYAVSGQEAVSFVTPLYCYAVSADAVYAYKTTGTENVLFKTMSAFTANRAGMPGIGWNTWWKIEDGQVVFGSYKTSI